MRPLSEITAPILPVPNRQRSVAYRRRRIVSDAWTCLVLIQHQETATEILVSDNGDAASAVWLAKAPVLIDPKFPGPFLVVQLTRTLAQQKGLSVCVLDWDRYTPAERAQLKDAVTSARHTRDRLSGRSQSSMGYMGRNSFA